MKKFLVTLLTVAGLFTVFAPVGQAVGVAVPEEVPAPSISARAWQILPHNARLFRSSTAPDNDALGIIHAGTLLWRGSRANNRYFVTFDLQANSNGWSGSAWINAVALDR